VTDHPRTTSGPAIDAILKFSYGEEILLVKPRARRKSKIAGERGSFQTAGHSKASTGATWRSSWSTPPPGA